MELLFCPDSGFDFAPHFHDAYCVWLNTNGRELYSHRGQTEILQPASFGIVAPGEVHSNRAIDKSARQLMTFYVQDAEIRSLLRQMGASIEIIFRSSFYHDSECHDLLVALFNVLVSSPLAMEREVAFLEVFSLLVQRHGVIKTPSCARGRDKIRISKTIELFRDRLGENLSLNDIAGEFSCTPYHLIRSFKKECGLSPHAYLLRLRLEKARELIRRGHPLVEVALETGFADQSHLNRHFKTNYGITPGAFKRQLLAA